jgi:hypothetical protein
MSEPLFRAVQRDMQISYIRTLAAHYLAVQENPDVRLRDTAKVLGMPESTVKGHWDRLDEYFGTALMEFDGRGRTGKLTSHGELAGALAAHFWTYDFILRNGGKLAEMGEFWVEGFKDDTRRMVAAARQLLDVMQDPGGSALRQEERDSLDDEGEV